MVTLRARIAENLTAVNAIVGIRDRLHEMHGIDQVTLNIELTNPNPR